MTTESIDRPADPFRILRTDGEKTPAEILLAVSTSPEAQAFVDNFSNDLKSNIREDEHTSHADELSRMHLADLVFVLAPERNPDYTQDKDNARRSIELVVEAMEERFKDVPSLDRKADRYVEFVAQRVREGKLLQGNIIELYSAPPRPN